MDWKHNPFTGNDIARYKNHNIVRLEGGGFYSSEIRFGLERKYLTFKSLNKCKDAINDEIERTTAP